MPTDFQILPTESGFSVTGELTFANAQAAIKAFSGLPQSSNLDAVQFDLSGLQAGDSAGLALLLSWRRGYIGSGAKVELTGVHDSLVRLIEISGLAPIFSN